MEFYDVIENRISCREFAKKPVEESKIKKILDAATTAPSAGDLKSYRIYVVKNAEAKKRLAEACLDQDFIADAPIVMVFCADRKRSALKYGERGEQLYSVQDATVAAAYSQLAATAEGLASVWVGAFDLFEIMDIITAEPYDVPIAVIPMGYPAGKLEKREGRNTDALIKRV